jgi:alpha-2-macroglobulin
MEATKQRAGIVTLYREYIDVQSRCPIIKTKAGQMVEVQLTVQIPQQAAYVIIEDQLSGGLEALHERLTARNSGQLNYGERQPGWLEDGYSYKDVRRDRVSFFVTDLFSGAYTTIYLARAVADGDFVALPTEAYAMYDEEIWGRSASNRFVVEK